MRPTYWLLPLGASVLIVAAGVLALWMIGSASGQRDRFSSLEIAPKESDVFIALNTDPTSPQWLAVNDSLEDINASDSIREFIDEALAEFELDWEEDILPAAGDEAYFSVPDIADVDEGKGWLAGVRLADPADGRLIFERLREITERDGGTPLEQVQYEGVTIYFEKTVSFLGDNSCDASGECTEPEDTVEEGVALAFVEDVLAIGATPDEVEAVIDVVQGRAPSAEENERLQDFRQYQREDFLVWGYADLAEVWDLAEEKLPVTLDTSGPNCTEIEPGVHACVSKPPQLFPDLTPVSDYVEFAADHEVTDLEYTVELTEPLPTSSRTGFYTSDGSGWTLVSELTLESGGTVARGHFDFLPKNVVVLRDDAELPAGRTPVPVEPPDAEIRVISFDAEYTVAGGVLQVTERIEIDFGGVPKHGIFRDVARRFDYDFENDQLVYLTGDIVALRDGVPEPFEVFPAGDNTDRIRLGDQNAEITGPHVYEVRYGVSNLIQQEYADYGAFYDLVWEVTGSGWAVPIERVSATFVVPAGAVSYTSCQVAPEPTDLWVIYNQDSCSYTVSEDLLTARFDALGPVPPGSGLGFLLEVNGDSGAPDPILIPDDNFDDEAFDALNPEPEDDEPFPINPLEEAPFDLREMIDELRGTYDRVGFALSSFDEGFAFDVTVVHAPGFEPEQRYEPATPYDSTLAGLVPADSMFFLSYFDVYGQSWLPAKEQLDDFEFENDATVDEFLADFMDETGIDLEADILALLTGEVAIAGNVHVAEGESPFEVIGLAQLSDPAHAEQTIDQLEDFLEAERLIAGNREGDVRVWEVIDQPDAEPLGVTVRGGNLIIGYPDGVIPDNAESDSLASTDDWKRTMDLLPDDKTFVGFVSLARVLEELEGSTYEDSFDEQSEGEITLADLAAIRSLGFSGTTRDDGFGFHAVLFVEER